MRFLRSFRLELEALSPVHVGTGEAYPAYAYVPDFARKAVHLLDPAALLLALPEARRRQYLEKVAQAGLCSKPYLAGTISNALPLFKLANGMTNDHDFVKTDNGYIWQPATKEFVDVIKQVNEWYDNGLLDPDAYVTDSDTAWEEYKNGLSPAVYNSASVGVYHDMLDDILKRSGFLPSNSEERAKLCDIYAIAAVESEDGKVYSNAVGNYYTMHAFSPNCPDATMVRILDMMD